MEGGAEGGRLMRMKSLLRITVFGSGMNAGGVGALKTKEAAVSPEMVPLQLTTNLTVLGDAEYKRLDGTLTVLSKHTHGSPTNDGCVSNHSPSTVIEARDVTSVTDSGSLRTPGQWMVRTAPLRA